MGKLNVLTHPHSLRLKKYGKADYIRWEHPVKGTIDVCVCSHNVDFTEGCIANVLGSNLESVLAFGGTYPDIEAIRKREGKRRVAKGCEICYARPRNERNIALRKIDAQTHADMQALVSARPRPVDRIIRLGKDTEVGHRWTRSLLTGFLELCKDYDARTILPTRMLEYDRHVARLLRDTNSSLFYSIHNDRFEVGPVSQGFTQAWRLQRAVEYADAGVNTSLTLICDMSASFGWNQSLGYSVKEFFLTSEQHGLRQRMLPMRIRGRKFALRATGRTWDELLKNNVDIFDGPHNGDFVREEPYKKSHGGYWLIINKMHPDFEAVYAKFDGNNVGACGKANGKEYCDKCALVYGSHVPHITFPVSQLAPVREHVAEAPVKTYKTLPLFRGNGVVV